MGTPQGEVRDKSTIVLSFQLGLRSHRVSCAVTLMDNDFAADVSVQGRAQMGRNTRIRARHAGVDGDLAAEVSPSKPSDIFFFQLVVILSC